MLCLSLGDSLAVGVGQKLPECRVEAEVGITSARFVTERLAPERADRVVISLGVNDGAAAHTLENLARVRSAVTARSVVWLLPFGHDPARRAIRTIASRFGDRTIDTSPYVGGDRLHPADAGYRTLARMVLPVPTNVMVGPDHDVGGDSGPTPASASARTTRLRPPHPAPQSARSHPRSGTPPFPRSDR